MSRDNRAVACWALVLLFASSCSVDVSQGLDSYPIGDDGSPYDRIGAAVSFETAKLSPTRCAFSTDLPVEPTCGWLEVPEQREDEDAADETIKIAVAVFGSEAAAGTYRSDPIFFLHGGPGGSILGSLGWRYDEVVGPWISTRDVVVLD